MRVRAKPWGRDCGALWAGCTTRFGLQACHSAGAQGFGLAFQLGNPFLQALNDRLLSDDDRNENLAAGAVQVNSGIHAYYMT